MIYYRVKPEYDNKIRYTYNNKHQGEPNSILIAHELYTAKEFQKIANCPAWFDRVEISERRVYWSFGARFEKRTED